MIIMLRVLITQTLPTTAYAGWQVSAAVDCRARNKGAGSRGTEKNGSVAEDGCDGSAAFRTRRCNGWLANEKQMRTDREKERKGKKSSLMGVQPQCWQYCRWQKDGDCQQRRLNR